MAYKGSCFVIMGYGVKTDYATGRNLDLDKTYKNIIKPAAEETNLKCVRADEIKHSGSIDVPMYRQLIEADVVIADLSASNPNAFYELGVRHALRPRTTIAIAENKLKPPFDINHTVIHPYEHLGTDIGYDEVMRFRKELVDTINTILDTKDIDSPVYTYLDGLVPPSMIENEKKNQDDNYSSKETLSTVIDSAKKSLDNDDFLTARALFEHANRIDKNNDYIIQKLALATYKSKHPSHKESLYSALKIIEQLDLSSSTDPETLGIAGAIFKRLWEETDEKENLKRSIYFYEKGFYIKNDYYNGINLAYLLSVSSVNQEDENEALTDYILANRVREQIVRICTKLKQSANFKDRDDQYWIEATLEEAYFCLGMDKEYNQAKKCAVSLSNQNWERQTTEQQIKKLKTIKQTFLNRHLLK